MTLWNIVVVGLVITAVGLAFYLGVQAAFRRTDQKLVLANARLVELLKQRKEQWETVFDTITDGIAVLDEKHQVQRGNRALLEQMDPAGVGAHICDTLFATPTHMHDLLRTVIETGTRHTMTAPSQRGGRLLRVTVAPMREQTTRKGRTVVVIEDITERQAMQGRLIHNERMAAVGQLASGVAHELNNPLTSIGGLAELLVSRESVKGRDLEHLSVISEQANRAKKIVRNLLAFARPGPDEVTDLDLSALSKRAGQLVEYDLRLRKVALEEHYASDLPTVRGDRQQLQQVVINLLSNAVQAAEQNAATRRPTVRISTGVNEDTAYIRIEDTGAGIPNTALKNIFTPFFSTKETGRGTGLGLSISYGIVKGHNGTLVVESTGPEGTSFKLDLPFQKGAKPTAQPSPTSSGALEALPRAPGASVLIVDADRAIRRTIETLFSGDDQHVDAIASADHAIERLRSGIVDYDLVIADPRTTTSHGESFAERLVHDWPALKTKTVLVTADVRPETGRWLDGLGCRVLTKPFNIKELLRAAGDVLREKPTDAVKTG